MYIHDTPFGHVSQCEDGKLPVTNWLGSCTMEYGNRFAEYGFVAEGRVCGCTSLLGQVSVVKMY
jgi:hypothetical protein